MPEIAGVGSQIVHLIGTARNDAPLLVRQIDPAGLGMMGIEIDHHQQDVPEILATFTVGNELFVVHGMKAQAPIVLERTVFAADAIDTRDEVPEAVGSRDVPVTQLIFFRAEILFAARLAWAVLGELEGGAVDAVARAERRGEHEAYGEGGAAAELYIFGEDVRRVGPEIGTKIFAAAALREFGEVLRDLPLGVAPRKIIVRLAEADLGEAVHHLGPREGLGEKDRLGMCAPRLFDEPVPQREGFGVRIVDAKDRHAVRQPEGDDLVELLPQLPPRLALEIEGIDVFVFLRGILRVLHAPVGPLAKPFGMLAYVGMIGRALKRDVARNLHAVLAHLGDEGIEVRKRAARGVHGGVTAFIGADGPGTARIVRACDEAVVAAFALDAAARVDGRQIHHVEAHRGDIGQPLAAIAIRAVAAGRVAARAREHLVPRAESRAFALDLDLEFLVIVGRVRAVGIARDQQREFFVQRGLDALRDFAAARELLRPGAQAQRVGALRPRRRLFDEELAGEQRALDVLVVGAPHELAPPRGEVIYPGADAVVITAGALDMEAAAPAVVAHRLHRRLAPHRLVRLAIEQHAGKDVETNGKRVGLDLDLFADRAFDGKAAAVDLGRHHNKHHTTTAVLLHGRGLLGATRISSSSGLVEHHAERRQRQGMRLIMAVRRHRRGLDAAEITVTRAAVLGGIAVEQLLPPAAARHTQAIIAARHRREIAHDQEHLVAVAAQKTQHALFPFVAAGPGETALIEILEMQRTLVAIAAVQVPHPIVHTLMQGILQHVPLEALVVIPLARLGEVVAHEQELLARMAVHVAVKRAQIGEALPFVARHLADQRTLAVHDLVVRKRQDEIFGEGVDQAEAELVVMMFAVQRIFRKIL